MWIAVETSAAARMDASSSERRRTIPATSPANASTTSRMCQPRMNGEVWRAPPRA